MLTNLQFLDRTIGRIMQGKILLVDDDPPARSALEILLQRQGFEVLTAGDGKAALEQCASFQPDLVLLDVVMPELDGLEVCRRIKADPETRLIPVVLITGLSEKSDRLKGIDAGADDFLSKPIDTVELMARTQSLLRMKTYTDELENAEAVLFSLALSIEGRDRYTHGHCQRLSNLSAQLGERLGLPPEQVTALRRAGIVHDIGKVALPDAVLLKAGPLSDDEKVLLRDHPAVGERICSPLKSMRLVLPIIRHHHEKLDGSGYPDGLCGEAIPFEARVLQVVDVYDALTTERSYRGPLTPTQALNLMKEEVERGWWDAKVFGAFRQLLEEVKSEMKKPPQKSTGPAARKVSSSPRKVAH